MSIPLNDSNSGISSTLVSGHFLVPDDLDTLYLLDYELGGFGLNDTSEGLDYQTWTLRYFPSTEDMVVQSPNTAPTILFNRPDITEISLAFDQNMNPFVTFVQAGTAVFWWWNTVTAQQEFDNLPANTITPRCCIDDKRDGRSGTSDIILTYVTSGVLYNRQERDRYTEQYTLQNPFVHPDTGLAAVLIKVGMNEHNRLQWLCDLASPDREGCP
jgi:hypothetical protein